jgi:ATP-binding cassette subfamily B protein
MAATVLSWGIAAVVMVWMVRRTLSGSANLGDLALFYQVFMQGQTLVRNAMKIISELYGNLFYLQNLFDFLALEPVVRAAQHLQPIPLDQAISVELINITFAYPGQSENLLENFNLTIPAGKITAIVGENGAGKSTLIKLLCRFYDPCSGKITFNGADLRAVDPQEVLKAITVLFQEAVRFHETAEINIRFGGLIKENNGQAVRAAALAGGADQFIRQLPQGYQTQMGKWFGGAELSSGEWQRLALSRAFYREAGLILLDEPTAMMDSWAESDWMKRFRTLAEGKTALVISHRFTTAMQADLIYVMRSGKIVESGTHQELLVKNGLYAVSWREQMQER